MSKPEQPYWPDQNKVPPPKPPKGWKPVGWVVAALFAGALFLGNAFFEPEDLEMSGEPASEGGPTANIAKADVVGVVPEGFERMEISPQGIQIVVPSNWERWDDQYFKDAALAAAKLTGGTSVAGQPVFSVAAKSDDGSPIAIVQLLVEPGPAPSQKQVREMLGSDNSALLELPARTAEYFADQVVPGMSFKVEESDWSDNGAVLCQYMKIEVTEIEIGQRKLRQWSCFNSSSVVWLTATYPSEVDKIYSEISTTMWESLRFELDQTPRLK